MRNTKEQYYENVVLKNRELVKNPEIMRCPCPNTLCDWHGKCQECVALHRLKKDHVPICLQGIIRDKIVALAGTVEATIINKPHTPIEYRHYKVEQDKKNGIG